MKHIFIALLSLSALSLNGQDLTLSKLNNTTVVWYGIDFTQARNWNGSRF